MWVGPLEQRLPGEQRITEGAEQVDVLRGGRLEAELLLGTVRKPLDPVLERRRRAEQVAESEVADANPRRIAVGLDAHRRGGEGTVDDPEAMRRVQAMADLVEDVADERGIVRAQVKRGRLEDVVAVDDHQALLVVPLDPCGMVDVGVLEAAEDPVGGLTQPFVRGAGPQAFAEGHASERAVVQRRVRDRVWPSPSTPGFERSHIWEYCKLPR